MSDALNRHNPPVAKCSASSGLRSEDGGRYPSVLRNTYQPLTNANRAAHVGPGILLIDATPLLEVVARGVVVFFSRG
ncbi:hypothetical protein ACLQ2Q_08495, partial [Microbacterium sp. DT81.1]|uniref:hypothetical protein n=1 Tax=Microbacterium sp. DT81.1 TaxID=3393413 RepID=UPI003CEE25EC